MSVAQALQSIPERLRRLFLPLDSALVLHGYDPATGLSDLATLSEKFYARRTDAPGELIVSVVQTPIASADVLGRSSFLTFNGTRYRIREALPPVNVGNTWKLFAVGDEREN